MGRAGAGRPGLETRNLRSKSPYKAPSQGAFTAPRGLIPEPLQTCFEHRRSWQRENRAGHGSIGQVPSAAV